MLKIDSSLQGQKLLPPPVFINAHKQHLVSHRYQDADSQKTMKLFPDDSICIVLQAYKKIQQILN